MKKVIVSSSKLGINCWSPQRYLGECGTCDRVMYCTIPEAHEGRIVLVKMRLEKKKAEYKKALAELNKLNEKE